MSGTGDSPPGVTPLASELVALCHAKDAEGAPRYAPTDIVEVLPFIFLLSCPNDGSFPVPPELQQLLDPPSEQSTRLAFCEAVRQHYEKNPPRSPLLREMSSLLRERMVGDNSSSLSAQTLLGAMPDSLIPVGANSDEPKNVDTTRRFSLKVPGEE